MTLFEQIYLNRYSQRIKESPVLCSRVGRNNYFFYKKLTEAYQSTEVDWIDDWFDGLYSDVNNLSKTSVKQIKQRSIEICDQHNITLNCFENLPEADIGIDSVFGVSYIPELEKIVINIDTRKFLETFKKGNEEFLVELRVHFYDMVTHEDIHVQQDYGHHEDYIEAKNPDDPDDPVNDPYYNQRVEVSAYARGIAKALVSLDFDRDKLLHSFTSSSEFKKLLKELIREYPDSGLTLERYYRNRKAYPKAWNKFRSYIYYFLSPEFS